MKSQLSISPSSIRRMIRNQNKVIFKKKNSIRLYLKKKIAFFPMCIFNCHFSSGRLGDNETSFSTFLTKEIN